MFRILTIFILCALSINCAWAKNPSKAESYRLYLSKLDKSDPDSIGKSVKEYHRIYSTKNDTKFQDASVNDWWVFNNSTLHQLNETLEQIGHLEDGVEADSKFVEALGSGKVREMDKKFEKVIGRKNTDFIEKLFDNGMEVYYSEGSPYVDYDPDFVDRSFSPYLSPSEKEFTRIRMKEFKEEFSNDAILQISWDDVRQRIVAWDDYLKKFPRSARKDEVLDEIKEYIEVYLSGMDNSPTYEEGQGNDNPRTLKADLKKSYETFLYKNKNCRYYKMVSEYYKSLKAHGFNCSEVNAGEYLAKNGLHTMSAIQPMLR